MVMEFDVKLTMEDMGTIMLALRKYASDYCRFEEDIDATYDTLKKISVIYDVHKQEITQ
jgi:hypothetical protein